MEKKNKKLNPLPLRLNLLFLLTFVMFSVLIFRLGTVQIVDGEKYLAQVEQSTMRSINVDAPRGWMMDRTGEVIVDNVPIYTVTYAVTPGIEQDLEEIAAYLSTLIDIEPEDIIDQVDPELTYDPQPIKTGNGEGISTEEMFLVSEHRDKMPGVEVVEDSKRNYVYDDLFSAFLGRVGPIPKEDVGQYLAKGYAMNEWVGLGHTLEYQYEDQLRGKPSITKFEVDRSQRLVGEPEHMPGQRGNDLMLTIDVDLQQKIEEVTNKIIEEHDEYTAGSDLSPLFVAMDPNTGEILGMSNNIFTYRSGQYPPGSTIKMATVLMALHEGIRNPAEILNDSTIYLGGDRLSISSWSPALGQVNARTAIERSSNIYMTQTVLEMAGASQRGGRQWSLSVEAARETTEVMRGYFAQFGLGVKTGIDLPGESSGRKPHVQAFGQLAFNSFGQFDEYTPLQLAQYVSTIANGGYRMQPHLVKQIRRGTPDNDELEEVMWQKQPNVLNRIDMSDEHLEIVREGMELVTQGTTGTARRTFGDFDVTVAAKTGTAETNREGIHHALLVGYAPADDPQIAFAAIAPYSLHSNNEQAVSIAQTMSRNILEFYFDNIHR